MNPFAFILGFFLVHARIFLNNIKLSVFRCRFYCVNICVFVKWRIFAMSFVTLPVYLFFFFFFGKLLVFAISFSVSYSWLELCMLMQKCFLICNHFFDLIFSNLSCVRKILNGKYSIIPLLYENCHTRSSHKDENDRFPL